MLQPHLPAPTAQMLQLLAAIADHPGMLVEARCNEETEMTSMDEGERTVMLLSTASLSQHHSSLAQQLRLPLPLHLPAYRCIHQLRVHSLALIRSSLLSCTYASLTHT